jgi:hypothetical protein
MLTYASKDIQHNKKVENPTRNWTIFSRFFGFHRFHLRTANTKTSRQKKKEDFLFRQKEERHTAVKNQLMDNNHGIIIHKTNHKIGCRHDYNIYKNHHPATPKQVVSVFDLGYLVGIEKDFPRQLSALPYKKQRNQQELSAEEKEYNVVHSKKRIVIEHTICRLKKYRIQSEIFRNKLRKYDKVSDIVSGLVNYRIMSQIR